MEDHPVRSQFGWTNYWLFMITIQFFILNWHLSDIAKTLHDLVDVLSK